MVFSLLGTWCSCFNAEGESNQNNSKSGLASGTNSAFSSGQVNSTSNQQMRPTLPPLPEIRPLEPLEPFTNVGQSNDMVGNTVPVKEKGDSAASKS